VRFWSARTPRRCHRVPTPIRSEKWRSTSTGGAESNFSSYVTRVGVFSCFFYLREDVFAFVIPLLSDSSISWVNPSRGPGGVGRNGGGGEATRGRGVQLPDACAQEEPSGEGDEAPSGRGVQRPDGLGTIGGQLLAAAVAASSSAPSTDARQRVGGSGAWFAASARWGKLEREERRGR
jgi:hypothetical protein